MWLEECDSFAELCRGYLPYYLLIVLPIFIIISPVNPVAASHEFPVYRMHQYDLHGVPHGKITVMSVIISLEIVRFSKEIAMIPTRLPKRTYFPGGEIVDWMEHFQALCRCEGSGYHTVCLPIYQKQGWCISDRFT